MSIQRNRRMRVGLILLLLIGVVLMAANKPATSAETSKKTKTEYTYLPRDLDTYIRDDMTYPSLVHGAMFTNEDVIR